MQQSAVDEPTAPDQAPLPQECGWFASSMELRAGLEVKESAMQNAWNSHEHW